MKLFFDQNLSFRLVNDLQDVFPGSLHVRDIGLKDADDASIWEYAKTNKLTIVSKDSDFHQRSFLFGQPPKVIWVRCGNRSTKHIEEILRTHLVDIEKFQKDENISFLVLS